MFTVEEYVQYERSAERRHEFINGQLFEMPGEKDSNNEIAGTLYVLFHMLLKQRGYTAYSHNVKVAIPGGNKFYYPDVFATREEKTADNRYIKYRPEIIVEVVSESSQVTDYVDKYMDYTRIPSLQYYLIVEPEAVLLTVYERSDNDEWTTRKYTGADETIFLSKLGVSFALGEVYA